MTFNSIVRIIPVFLLSFAVYENITVKQVRASGRSRKKVKFRGIFRDKFAEKTVDFAGISREFSRPVSLKNDCKERPISWELPEQISLESDWFALI